MASEKSCLSMTGEPIEIVSGVPKDMQGLRLALRDMLASKLGGGVEAYPGPVAAGMDPLQSMASNILSQQMYGQNYPGPNVSNAPWLGSGLEGMGGSGSGGGSGSPSKNYKMSSSFNPNYPFMADLSKMTQLWTPNSSTGEDWYGMNASRGIPPGSTLPPGYPYDPWSGLS